MKKTKIFLYILLGLLVIGLVPIVFLNTWAMCRLWQVGREKTPEGLNRWEETVRIAKTVPAGKNLLEIPLWQTFMDEHLSEGSNMFFSGVSHSSGMSTNALSVWESKLDARKDFYWNTSPIGAPKEEKSYAMELPTLERIRAEVAKMNKKRSRSKEMTENVLLLQGLLERYDVEGSELSEEKKVASLFLEYVDLENDPVWGEVQKSLKECSYFGIPWEKYIKEYGRGDENFLYFITLPHLSTLRTLAEDAVLKAQCYSVLGDREKCLSELERALDLVYLKQQSPMLLNFLIRMRDERVIFNIIHEVIARNILTEEDLTGIQTRLAQINPTEDLLYCLEGEQFWGEKMIGHPATLSDNGKVPWTLSFLWRASGLIPFNKATYIQMFWKLQDALNPESQTMDYATWKSAGEGSESIFNFMCKPLAPATDRILYKFLRYQSEKDATVLACALERYRLKEGSFPEKLEMLIPKYLPQMPPGSLEQGSLSYNRTEKGYELILNKLPGVTDIPPSFPPEESGVEVVWKRSRE